MQPARVLYTDTKMFFFKLKKPAYKTINANILQQ